MSRKSLPDNVRPLSVQGLPQRRVWTFRLLAICLGFTPFVVAELTLRALRLPQRALPADPYVDLHNLRPLFEPESTASDVMKISESRLHLFQPADFRVSKEKETLRIFALGGSTTQGEPYSTPTAFPAWMGLCLELAADSDVEVINCGGLSYASYRVLAILREVLAYNPDLVVIYTGHNEYLERRSYQDYRHRSVSSHLYSLASELRLVQLTKGLVPGRQIPPQRSQPNQTVLESEVDALLDYQGGLADYQRGATWYAGVAEHFEWNLGQMVEACRRQGTPLIFVTPVSNLRDCPPMKSDVDPELSPAARRRFALHWNRARTTPDAEQALRSVRDALQIDPQHAAANYLLGQLHLDRAETEAAQLRLLKAKDFDVCPLRATTQISNIFRRVASAEQVPTVDAEQLFAKRSEHGLVGDRWLVDHIHPTVAGHQLLGQELAELCLSFEIVPEANPKWRDELEDAFARHLSELDESYFHRGKQRLEGLKLWTQGRAKKIRAD